MLRLGYHHVSRSLPYSRPTSTHLRIIMSIDGEYVGHLKHITTSGGSRRRSARLLSAPIHVQAKSTPDPETLDEVKAPLVPHRRAKRRKVEEPRQQQVSLDVALTLQASPQLRIIVKYLKTTTTTKRIQIVPRLQNLKGADGLKKTRCM